MNLLNPDAVRYMRPRDIFYLAMPLLCGVASVGMARAATVAGWGPAWQQTVPAGGPVSLSRALVAIAPPGQTVVVDLPRTLKRTEVRWPATDRKSALRDAVLAVDHNAEIAVGEHCAGEVLKVYATPADNAYPQGIRSAPVIAASSPPTTGAQRTPSLPVNVSAHRPAPAPAAPAVPKIWLISKGELMSKALDRWGSRHGWTVVWKARRLAKRWHAPAFAAIPGTFLSAVGLWAHSAISNGAPIRLIEYRANNTLVVESTDGDDNGF